MTPIDHLLTILDTIIGCLVAIVLYTFANSQRDDDNWGGRV